MQDYDATLSQERKITGGDGIDLTDNGANDTLDIDVDSTVLRTNDNDQTITSTSGDCLLSIDAQATPSAQAKLKTFADGIECTLGAVGDSYAGADAGTWAGSGGVVSIGGDLILDAQGANGIIAATNSVVRLGIASNGVISYGTDESFDTDFQMHSDTAGAYLRFRSNGSSSYINTYGSGNEFVMQSSDFLKFESASGSHAITNCGDDWRVGDVDDSDAIELCYETGENQFGVLDSSPAATLDVNGDIRGNSYADHSMIFIGDALGALRNVQPGKGNKFAGRHIKAAGWVDVDHDTLPPGVLMEYQDDYVIKDGKPIARAGHLGIDCKDPPNDITIEKRTTQCRDIGASVQVNTRAIIQLLEKIEALEEKIEDLQAGAVPVSGRAKDASGGAAAGAAIVALALRRKK